MNNERLAKARCEEVLNIIDDETERRNGNNPFNIHDARWCIKLLAEAIIALLPEEPS